MATGMCWWLLTITQNGVRFKAVMDHDAETTTMFLENEVICRFGVLKYILIDNGIERSTEFD
jgi:hypothetical protein